MVKGKQREKINLKAENGITLIALIVMIVILIILAAVVIRGFTGNEGIVDATVNAAEDYNVTAYREQIEQAVRGIIVKRTTLGEEITIAEIAKALNEETIWVKSAQEYPDKNITNPDILVKITDGYVYQVHYDSLYGAVFVEYVGNDDGKEFPTLKARYENSYARVLAESKCNDGSISKIEMLYRGEIKDPVRENPTGEVWFDVENIGTGWYVVKATSNTGKLRYAWVRVRSVSEKLQKPIITLNPSRPAGGDWYNTQVEVTITADLPSGAKIYYSIPDVNNPESSEQKIKYEGPFQINRLGSTTIRAWTEDEAGLGSLEEDIRIIKIDTEKPTTTHEETSAKPQVGGWYKADVTISINGVDNHSGLAGYKYMIKDENNSWVNKTMDDKLLITKEGITEITAKTVDIATNESIPITINITKDTVAPVFQGSMNVTNATTTGFSINGYAIDAISGNATFGGKITYECYVTEVGTDTRTKVGSSNDTGIFTATGLRPRKEYNVEIFATDPAGNTSTLNGRGTTLGELKQPSIEISGTKGNNNWYKGTINVAITDTAASDATSATSLHYEVINQSNNSVVRSGSGSVPTTTFTWDLDGSYTVRAWAQDDNSTNGDVAENTTLKRDATAPAAPSISLSGTVGTNSYYKSNVTVTINAGSDSTSGVQAVRYKVEGKQTVAQKDVNGSSTTQSITVDGDSTVTAWTIDNAGNVSSQKSQVVKKDATAPGAPTISLSGTAGTNSYYKSNVTVTISAGSDSTSGVQAIRYKVTGRQTVAQKDVNGSSTTQSITVDGDSTITAWTVDKAGNVSVQVTKVVKKDSTPPTATLTHNSHTSNTITVIAGGTDATSGINNYRFQYKLSTETAWRDATTQTGTGYTYPSSMISAGKTYNLRVIVSDKAGNSKESASITVAMNRAPVFATQAYASGRSTTSITVKAKATDADGNNLNYTLRYGTSSSNLNLSKSQSGVAQNSVVTFSLTGLANYTTYYFQVTVSDGTATVSGTLANAKTKCPTTRCDGPFTRQETCTGCSGSGNVPFTCNRYMEVN